MHFASPCLIPTFKFVLQVVEQQSTLQQVGVPGFHETDNPIEIKIQMYILEFIVKLGGIKVPP